MDVNCPTREEGAARVPESLRRQAAPTLPTPLRGAGSATKIRRPPWLRKRSDAPTFEAEAPILL